MTQVAIERVFVVTGASRGLGEAIALALLAPDAAVVGLARGRSRALDARAAAGDRIDQVACDLEDTGSLDALLAGIMARLPLGRCTLVALVNNAGTVEPVGPVGSLEAAEIGRHLALNLLAPIILSNAFVRETRSLAAARRIVNVSSGSGRRAYSGWAAYCAGKAGLDHFSRTLALEQQGLPDGVRVVALAPGIIDTDMQATVRAQGVERFPDVERFRELARSGSLVAPAVAARRIAAFLGAESFGAQPVADLREMPA